jgi:hypothetical protein
MAFTVTWARDGTPEVLDDRFEYEIDNGVLNISAAGGGLLVQYAAHAWFSVHPYVSAEAKTVEREQPSFGRMASGPGLNWRAARQQGYERQ